MQSACSMAVVTHALIISSGDVALARRYLANSEKVVDEMLLMTYDQDKWLIQHGKQQQAAGEGAPVALVSDADAIKLQVTAQLARVRVLVLVFVTCHADNWPSRGERSVAVAKRQQMKQIARTFLRDAAADTGRSKCSWHGCCCIRKPGSVFFNRIMQPVMHLPPPPPTLYLLDIVYE